MLVVAILAITAAAGARRSGLRWLAPFAAVLVGLLAGPGVLGRLAPETFRTAWVIDQPALDTVRELEARRAALGQFAIEAGAAEASVSGGHASIATTEPETAVVTAETPNADAETAAAIGALDDEIRIARTAAINAHRALARWFVVVGATLAIGVGLHRWRRSSPRSGEPQLEALTGPVRVGAAILTAIVPALALVALARFAPEPFRLGGTTSERNALLATLIACLAIAVARPARAAVLRSAGLDGGQLLHTTAFVGMTLAFALLVFRTIGSPGNAVALGVLALAPLALLRSPSDPRTAARSATRLHAIALPAALAVALLHVEIHRDVAIGPILVALLLGGDLRWLGGWIGLRASGVPGVPAARASIWSADTALPMALLAVALAMLDVLPPSWTLAIVLSAATGAALDATRRETDRMLRTFGDEIARDHD